MKRLYLLLYTLSLLLCGCTSYQKVGLSDFQLGDIGPFTFTGGDLSSDISVSCKAVNPTATRFQIVSCEAVIYKNDKELGYLSSRDTIVIEPHFDGTLESNVSITMNSPLSIISLGLQALSKTEDFDKMAVDYEIKLKSGNLSRKFARKGVPLTSLLETLKDLNQR